MPVYEPAEPRDVEGGNEEATCLQDHHLYHVYNNYDHGDIEQSRADHINHHYHNHHILYKLLPW